MSSLAHILEETRKRIAALKSGSALKKLEKEAAEAPPVRGFADRLVRDLPPVIIAEIKRASPSRGVIWQGRFDAAAIARSYEEAGAACLSVLTEPTFFKGAASHLGEARAATRLPVLRKDFMLEPCQIVESRAIGADCVLLILAALKDRQAQELMQLAAEFKMDVLVECHTETELARAVALGARLIGVNNRNLRTLQVDLSVAESMLGFLPPDCIAVAESGIRDSADIGRLQSAGARAFLIGEALMQGGDPGTALKNLIGTSVALH